MSHKQSPQQKDELTTGQLAAKKLAERLETKAANRAFNDLVKRARKRGALVGDVPPGIGGVQVGPTHTITVNIKPKFLQTQFDLK
jgi:hypothetical protein